MLIYPYSTPLILTEDIYVEYGGQTGTSTATQRQNAFLIAEQRASKYIGTFLLPTIVTGTYPYNSSNFIVTDYGYVSQILSANVLSLQGSTTCELKSDSGCAYIFEDTFGYLNYSCVQSLCNCAVYQSPYQFQIAYEAGLPTGTANQAGILQALTIVANIGLGQVAGGCGSDGDVGITEWSSMDYKEKRKDWPVTSLGASAKAGYAADLIKATIRLVRPAITLR